MTYNQFYEGVFRLLGGVLVLGLVLVCLLYWPAKLICRSDPREARISCTKMSLSELAAAATAYHRDCGVWPANAADLSSLVTNTAAVTGWNGPYIRQEGKLNDSWGTPIHLEKQGAGAAVVSAGEDCVFGTGDDVRSVIDGSGRADASAIRPRRHDAAQRPPTCSSAAQPAERQRASGDRAPELQDAETCASGDRAPELQDAETCASGDRAPEQSRQSQDAPEKGNN